MAYTTPLAGNPTGDLAFAGTVKTADGAELKAACPTSTRLSLACMNMNAVMGGAACHWGGPSAYAEIMSATHGMMFAADDWRESFNFVNDAGHAENGIYALKANYGFAGVTFEDLKGFRSISSKLTGHGEGHIFPEGIMISNGPLGSGLPIAQGLAMADRVADKKRTTICVISDGAMMEGEAREAVAAIPGFGRQGQAGALRDAVSENDTKLSGRIDEQAFTMQPTFEALDDTGWTVVKVEHGNDLQTVFSAIEKAVADVNADPTKPIALWVKTIKGYGVKKTVDSASGGHGYPLKTGAEVRPFVEEISKNAGLPPVTCPIFDQWIAEIEKPPVNKAKPPQAPASGR